MPAIDDKKQHARKVVQGLKKAYPDAECALTFHSPYELVVATILSAQCTDERVNMVTPVLFKKYPTAGKLAAAKQADVEKIVQSTGFFRAKARNLREMAIAVVEKHGGEIPRNLDDMVLLPGIGRKTANVVLGTAFGIASGVVVDTHVKRLSYRLGLTKQTNPEKIEQNLIAVLPTKEWIDFAHRMIHHGRRVCYARKPNCAGCSLLKICPREGLPPLAE